MQKSSIYIKLLKNIDNNDITLKNLYNFYSYRENLKIFIAIILAESSISIRLIDWFVTNYAKKNNIIYKLDDTDDDNNIFNVYIEYKCQLKSYKKKLFDPFCRKNKIYFYYNLFDNPVDETNTKKHSGIITTIGQLNFFRWAIKYDIIKYIENNSNIIYQDMILNNKKLFSENSSENNNSTSETKKKRHELSVNANRYVNIHNYSIVLNID